MSKLSDEENLVVAVACYRYARELEENIVKFTAEGNEGAAAFCKKKLDLAISVADRTINASM